MAWVVRAGEAKAVDLMKGYREHLGVSGLYGFSVQYHPGISWQELARAGQYPNAQVSVAEEDALHLALRALGYDLRLVSSPGVGYHHTFVVLYDATGGMLTQLPLQVAEKLHETFYPSAQPAPGAAWEDAMMMKRIAVDFNTLTSAPVGLVKYLQEDGQPPLREGERVLLYDADGLEVEATIMPFTTARGEQLWLAEPDAATWRDAQPQQAPLPPTPREEAPRN